jgi:hypothetical protein
MLWAWPALRSGEADLIRLLATEFLLLIGALIVICVERECAANESAPTLHPDAEALPVAA